MVVGDLGRNEVVIFCCLGGWVRWVKLGPNLRRCQSEMRVDRLKRDDVEEIRLFNFRCVEDGELLVFGGGMGMFLILLEFYDLVILKYVGVKGR